MLATSSLPPQALPSMSAIPMNDSSSITSNGDKFAFARIYDSICLIQIESIAYAMTPIDVNIFRHEFGTMFRYSHRLTVHPNDVQLLFSINDGQLLSEDSGVVFVARDVTDKLLQWTSPVRRPNPAQQTRRRR